MNIRKFTCALLFGISMMMNAGNTVTTIKQVTDGVTVSDDVDYVIESEDPFATSGSVNITNTEHAVVIFGCIKPSKVISTYLKDKVFVNGVQAENSKNCQNFASVQTKNASKPNPYVNAVSYRKNNR